MPRHAASKAEIPGAEQSNIDEAIALSKQGIARPIRKPRLAVPPAQTDRPDPSRAESAFVNRVAKADVISHDDAMALDNQGKLQKAVMTEQGWYCPQNSTKMRQERRRNGQDEMVHIETNTQDYDAADAFDLPDAE